jgi:hypothetical protein
MFSTVLITQAVSMSKVLRCIKLQQDRAREAVAESGRQPHQLCRHLRHCARRQPGRMPLTFICT